MKMKSIPEYSLLNFYCTVQKRKIFCSLPLSREVDPSPPPLLPVRTWRTLELGEDGADNVVGYEETLGVGESQPAHAAIRRSSAAQLY